MVHLHTRSCFSLLQSSLRLNDIVDAAIAHGFSHAVLTDYNVMYGTMQFWHLCKEKNIHPIFGLEMKAQKEEHPIGFILLAKDDEGLQDLFRLSTYISNHEQPIEVEDLKQYTKHTVVMTTGMNDRLDELMSRNRFEELEMFLLSIADVADDFYVSMAMNDAKFRANKNIELKKICEKCQFKTVALSEILYLRPEDVEQVKILRAIDKQTSILDTTLDIRYDRYYRSQAEMEVLYDEADLLETEEIAKRCNVQMAMPKSKLPVFQNKFEMDSKTYLVKLCQTGLKKRLNNQLTKEYVQRLEYELNVINSMGFTDYFLIVYDMIRFARSQDILIGPGRGSAAGSLVAYCLGITHIDPIQNHLLFERFLNPERISMPDIDTDIPDNRREEVIDYLVEKYGQKQVAHIVTFSAMKAKQAMRDVGRVLGFTVRQIDMLTKYIPRGVNVTLQMAYDQEPKFRKIIQSKKDFVHLFEWAKKIEGLPRHISLHAAGIVISNQPIENVCPLVQVDEGVWATQYTMEYLEELGLIKMDLLALRNLSTMDSIVQNIRKEQHIPIDVFKLPLNDVRTYQLLSNADTVGIFQLESEGIKSLLRKMKPCRFEDISAVLALYRPGPMENIPLYLERRAHPERIQYAHPLLQPILEQTYGIMVYQEQIMQVAQVIAGFSLAQADNLRKAMSKKKLDVMESYKEAFVQGALKNKIPFKTAQEIFDTMEKFASYGFNKSHSYAYSMIAYQMAYLKANYPLYFYQSLLNSVMNVPEKTAVYMFESQRRNVPVFPCDLQKSQESYAIENKGLRMPFQILKGIGKSVYPKIIEERNKRPFEDVIDCLARLSAIKINEGCIRILIDGGAFDSFGYNRTTLLENLDRIWAYVNIVKIESDQIQFDYSIASRPMIQKMHENVLVKSEREQAVYGFYMSEHPIRTLRNERFPRLKPLDCIKEYIGYVQGLARIVEVRMHKTKYGDMMCFAKVEDESAQFDLVIMPDIYRMHRESLEAKNMIYFEGKKDRPDSILVRKMKKIQMD